MFQVCACVYVCVRVRVCEVFAYRDDRLILKWISSRFYRSNFRITFHD